MKTVYMGDAPKHYRDLWHSSRWREFSDWSFYACHVKRGLRETFLAWLAGAP